MKKTDVYARLPITFLIFWYYEKPRELLHFFRSLNAAYLHLFSLPLFVRTFFKPLKNEYREGLVKFSIAMGMVVKSVFILVETPIFLLLLFVEVFVLFFFLALPLVTLGLFFW